MIIGDDKMSNDTYGNNSNRGNPWKVDKFQQESRSIKEGGGVDPLTLIIENNLSMTLGSSRESRSSFGGTREDNIMHHSSQVGLSNPFPSNISAQKGNGKNLSNWKRRARVGNSQKNTDLIDKPVELNLIDPIKNKSKEDAVDLLVNKRAKCQNGVVDNHLSELVEVAVTMNLVCWNYRELGNSRIVRELHLM